MEQKRGTLSQCLLHIESHAQPHRAEAILEMDLSGRLLKQQLRKIFVEAQTASQQIKKIKEAATTGGHQDILAILNEKVGINYGPTE